MSTQTIDVKEYMPPRSISGKLLVGALLIWTWVAIIHADQAQYLYDELGRLVGVADGTGVTAVYNYDAVGNLTNIQRSTPPGSGIGIYLAAPGSGQATTQVTIQGYGFDPTPANNTVQFNGTAASANTLVVTVPAGQIVPGIGWFDVNGCENGYRREGLDSNR